MGGEQRKRLRSLSVSSSSSDSSMASASSPPGPSSPAAKYHRRTSSVDKPHICTLAPTCNQPGTSQSFATAQELETHQASLHRWICRVPVRDKPGGKAEGEPVIVIPEQFTGRFSSGRPNERWRECGKVFPDERIMDLHYTESHDPITRERQERGEKIFACFLPPEQCSKTFLTPKKRRLHLIDKHHYPVGYFFSITNHGLNQIARKEGPAASLIRPRRDPPAVVGLSSSPASDLMALDNRPPLQTHVRSGSGGLHQAPHHGEPIRPVEDMDIDDLTTKMAGMKSSLSFVPRNVRRARARAVMDLGWSGGSG